MQISLIKRRRKHVKNMEINFQRGGQVPIRKPRKTNEGNFGARNEENEKSKQKQSKRERIKKIQSEKVDDENKEINSAKPLTLATLASDMIIMGIVKSAHPAHLFVSLPGRLIGKVPITNISRSYSKFLSTILENQDLVTKPKTLPELFTPGQIIYVKVLDKCHGEREEILLSLLPEDINSEISSGALAEGNIILCAVEEEEDHGYIMESGIRGFKSFLPKKNVKAQTLSTGELVFCKIKKISPTAVTLTMFKKNEMLKIETIDVPNLKTLMPGTIIDFNIARILKNGLEGLVFDGSVTAYANEMYLPAKISMTDSQIIGKEVRARILYTMPLSNQLFVTLLTEDPAKPKTKIPFGTLLDSAKVIKQTSGGVLMKLNANDRGFLPRKVIVRNLKNNFDIDSALIKFAPNTIHVLRVMDFNLFENCYLCTNDPKLLHEKFFSTHDLEIGKILQAKVEEKLGDGGYRMSIGNVRAYLKGFFLNQSPKITVGENLKVRVAEIDHQMKVVQVTNLHGFLRETAKIVTARKQIKFRESYTGVVMKESDKFYSILFFNHVKGQLPKTPETEADIISLGGLKVGSVKNFEVKNVKGDRITLAIPKKVDTSNLGRIFDCKISAVLPSGLQVFIEELKVYGKVPINFLSEFPTLAPLIHAQMKEGQVLKVVALTNNLYSRRDVEYYRSGVVTDFKEINPGDTLRCYVKSTDFETIELECPLKNFNDTIILNRNAFDNPDEVVLNPDDIVYVSVISKTEGHHNSLFVTPALHKVWRSEMNLPLDIVQSYLGDISLLLKSNEKIGKFTIGQRISGTIKNIIGSNLLIEVSGGIYAQGSVDNVQSFKIGGSVKDGVVVWLDPVTSMIHVTLKDKCKDEISIDQEFDKKIVSEKKHKAIIVFFNDFVTVCSLRKSGQPLVYAPTKFHYNDFSPVTSRALGNATSKLVIKRASDKHLLGAFVHDYKIFQKVEKFKSKLGEKRKGGETGTAVEEIKKPKVILDDSDDEGRKTETDESEAEEKAPQPSPPKKLEKSQSFGKSLKRTLSRSGVKIPIKKKKFLNKDSLLNTSSVNLVSYKSFKEGEAGAGKKPVKALVKSTIGKKIKTKRIGKKK